MNYRNSAKLFVVILAIAALPAGSFAQETPKPAKKAEDKSKGLQFELHFDNLLLEIADEKPEDKKIKEIEARIAELTKQLQALKQGKQPAEAPKKEPVKELKVDEKDPAAMARKVLEQMLTHMPPLEKGPMPPEAPKVKAATPTRSFIGIIVDEPASKPIALSRATYKLSKEKAEALMTFLKTNTKPAVLEFKFDEKGLTVTTTPDFQTTIASVVKLMRPEQQFELHFDHMIFEIADDKPEVKKAKEIEAQIAELKKLVEALKHGPAEAPKKAPPK